MNALLFQDLICQRVDRGACYPKKQAMKNSADMPPFQPSRLIS